MKSVLQAGHWKSLKTSMMMGADLEPAATCGSISGTGAEDCRAFAPSPEANSNAAKPARVKASELAPRERTPGGFPRVRQDPQRPTCGRQAKALLIWPQVRHGFSRALTKTGI